MNKNPFIERWIHPQCVLDDTDIRSEPREKSNDRDCGKSCYRCGNPGVGPMHPIIQKYEVRETEEQQEITKSRVEENKKFEAELDKRRRGITPAIEAARAAASKARREAAKQ